MVHFLFLVVLFLYQVLPCRPSATPHFLFALCGGGTVAAHSRLETAGHYLWLTLGGPLTNRKGWSGISHGLKNWTRFQTMQHSNIGVKVYGKSNEMSWLWPWPVRSGKLVSKKIIRKRLNPYLIFTEGLKHLPNVANVLHISSPSVLCACQNKRGIYWLYFGRMPDESFTQYLSALKNPIDCPPRITVHLICAVHCARNMHVITWIYFPFTRLLSVNYF